MRDSVIAEAFHGTVSFPFEIVENEAQARTESEQLIYTHYHSHMELIYVEEGSIRLESDLENDVVSAGEAVFIHPNAIHAGYTHPGMSCRVQAIIFDPLLVMRGGGGRMSEAEVAGPDENFHWKPLLTGSEKWGQEALSIIRGIIADYYEKAEAYEWLVLAGLYRLFGLLLRHHHYHKQAHTPVLKSQQLQRFRSIYDYITKHYADRIEVQALAKQAHLSEDYFYRWFRQITGQTPVEYINCLRIQIAGKQLTAGKATIAEIASNVGMEDMNHFIRTFKRKTGMTPNQYRKHTRNQPSDKK